MDTCGESLAEQGEHKTLSRSGRNTAVNPWEDFTRTIFIGNLPFVVSEEEVRGLFADCGDIENVRLVRDPKTFLGKGIGYVMFTTKEAMLKALQDKKTVKYKGRELRVNRAVEPKRREKKQRRKQERLEERRERRRKLQEGDASDSDGEPLPPKVFGDAYSSEDSEDEKFQQKKQAKAKAKAEKLPPVVHLEDTEFGKRGTSQVNADKTGELDLSNLHKQTSRKKQALLANMIKNGSSFKGESMASMSKEEKDLYKGKHDTFKKGLVAKIEKRKASNLKKINKIKVKTKKI